jgi:hypothetical protein
VAPLAPERYAVQFTMGQAAHEWLRSTEDLLGHQLKADEMEQVFSLGLQAMIAKLEKQKFAATDRPRAQRRPARGRRIPAAVKRVVRERDGRRCTFVAANGRRCEARSYLEFDHILPVARGGATTAENLRLLCRAHNQYEAELRFGAGFMDEKREQARNACSNGRGDATGDKQAGDAGAPDAQPADLDITPWLRKLGFRAREARQAAALCQHMHGATLEERVRAALSHLAPPARRSPAPFGRGKGLQVAAV